MDKTHDKSHRLHAMHYNLDLVVITPSSAHCDHKKKNNNMQTDKQNIKLPNQKKQMKKKRKEKKQRKQKNLTGFEHWTSRCRVLVVTPRLHMYRY